VYILLNKNFRNKLNSEQKVEECDARDDDSSIAAGKIIITSAELYVITISLISFSTYPHTAVYYLSVKLFFCYICR